MEFKRATEIIIATKRRFVICQPETAEQYLCPRCDEAMLAAEQTAVVFNLSRRTVYQLVESGAAHFAETEAGLLLVCPNSLAETLARRTELKGEK